MGYLEDAGIGWGPTEVRDLTLEQTCWKASKYAVVRKVISKSTTEIMRNYSMLQRQAKGYYTRYEYYKSDDVYADVFSESLLLWVQPIIEKVTGVKLLPCYSKIRIYGPGGVLEKHIDRPACEISATLTVDYDSHSTWPIFLEENGREMVADLDFGDMLIFKGSELAHWRETFEGKYWIQVFLHYVDADGGFTELKFDRRDGIGPFKIKSNYSRMLKKIFGK